jgi:hypothetical protein
MSTSIVIKNADWVVAYDGNTQGHKYIRNGDVAFSGDSIDYVGKNFEGESGLEISGKQGLLRGSCQQAHVDDPALRIHLGDPRG